MKAGMVEGGARKLPESPPIRLRERKYSENILFQPSSKINAKNLTNFTKRGNCEYYTNILVRGGVTKIVLNCGCTLLVGKGKRRRKEGRGKKEGGVGYIN